MRTLMVLSGVTTERQALAAEGEAKPERYVLLGSYSADIRATAKFKEKQSTYVPPHSGSLKVCERWCNCWHKRKDLTCPSFQAAWEKVLKRCADEDNKLAGIDQFHDNEG